MATVMQPQKRKRNKRARVIVELNKYKTLIDTLGDRHTVRRVVLTIFVLGIILFTGITFITLSIKRLYPYSDITTNGLGATTIKSEKNEVSYWLFNTATLWANSGIHVNKGDVIIIRASGKSHTAIHHLYNTSSNNYEAAGDNNDAYHEWVGSEGLPKENETGRGKYRRKFRIFPDERSGALLMQVSNGHPKDTPQDEGANPENFYFIGKERHNIIINNEGYLHFAVNDIVLNKSTITNMMWENIRLEYIEKKDEQVEKSVKDYLEQTKKPKDISEYKELRLKETDSTEWMDDIKNLFEEVFKTKINEANQKESDAVTANLGKMELGYTRVKSRTSNKDSLVCELSYYYGDNPKENEKRKTVWFDDNIGSFLIVIEKLNK